MRATKWAAPGAILASLVLAVSCDDEPGILPITLSSDCNACHVGVDAPTSGNHSTHVGIAGYACTRCHDGYSDDPAHNNGIPETGVGLVTFDAPNAAAVYDGTTCSNTWCHGPSSLNVATSPPDWGASPIVCGNCHMVPMSDAGLTSTGGTHTTHANCYGCHSDVVNSDNTTFADESRHVDGIVDVSAALCGACHTTPATDGHPTHVTTEGFACEKCHDGYLTDANHINGSPDTGIGLVNFDIDNPAATYDGTNCSSTWCHGPSSRAGDPVWGGAAMACGDCHTVPMDGTATTGGPDHTTTANCYSCHAAVIQSDNTTFEDPALHIDFSKQYDISSAACADCHATPATTSHTGHVTGLGYACTKCHNGYVGSASHYNYVSESAGLVAFDTDNPSGTYNEGTSSCGSTWCHGPNSVSADPVWDVSTMSCGQCHPNPPTVGSHIVHTGNLFSDPSAPKYDFACSECHEGAGDGTALHVNFTVDVALDPFASSLATGYGANGGNIPTWNAGPKSCSNVYCHSNGVTKEKGGAYDLGDIGSPPDGVLSYNTPVWGGSVSCGDCHAGEPLGTPLTGGDYPNTGAHRSSWHATSPNNRPTTGYVPCSSCHSTAVGDALQGTYGSAEHVDGLLKFHPYAVPSPGTIQNPEGSDRSYDDGHCGNALGCWYQ